VIVSFSEVAPVAGWTPTLAVPTPMVSLLGVPVTCAIIDSSSMERFIPGCHHPNSHSQWLPRLELT
jgi:hypothetical protein